jgi:hypothetical protein
VLTERAAEQPLDDGSYADAVVAAFRPACDGWAVRPGSITPGHMRLFLTLTFAAAALLICGLTLVFIGVGLHLESAHDGHGLVYAAAVIALCGFAFGAAVLAVLAADLGGRGGLPSRAAALAPAAAVPAPRLSPLSPQEPAPPVPSPQPADAGGGYGYADDVWDPEFGDTWSPGPAYVWAPAGGHDGGDAAGEGWAPDDRDEWDPAGLPDWDGSGQLWASAGRGAAGPASAAEPGQDEPATFSVWEPAPKQSVREPGPMRPPPAETQQKPE